MFLYLLFNNNSNLLMEKIRIASFNVVSILSGTGYVTNDFSLWGKFPLIFFIFLMFIGGCAGSTATLKYGVEQMVKHFVPEVTSVEAQDGFSEVDPYYSGGMDSWDMIPMNQDGLDYE
jgi:hypothetical protein